MSSSAVARRSIALVGAFLLTALLVVPAQLAGAKDEVGVPTRSESSGIASRWGSYIVVMKANPLAATVGVDDFGTAPARNRESRLLASHNRVLRSLGAGVTKIHDYTVALNGFSALMSPEQAATVAANKNVVLILPDELHQPQTDSSPAFLGLSAPGGAYASEVDGEGVVVGVIDTGIWPEHPSFADDGSYPEPPPPPGVPPTVLRCEFGNTAHNPNDAPFACNNKLIGADQVLDTYREILGADPDEFDSARDDDGHGSHTASTAAGNSGVEASVLDRNIATIAGIAPRAHISVYKALGNQGGFGSDLAEAIDLAVEDGVDVINYSIGGGASLTGADDIAFLFAADAGVFVATSAGNSGPGEATIGGPASVPWLTTVGANTQSRFFEGTVILGNGAEYTGASITHGVGPAKVVDAATSSHHGSDLCLAGTLRRGKVRDAIVLCRRGPGRVAKSQEVMRAGGVGMILYENSDAGNLFSDTHWVPSVHVDNTPGLAIKSYIASAEKKKLATAELVTGEVSTWPNAPTMTDFSSRGPDPVAEDIIKPDVTAPGLQILAGASPFPDPGFVPDELFQAIAGTSMSSPHVAGLFALISQEHPDWSAAAAKSALMTTADTDVRDNDRVSQATPFEMGAGQPDLGGPGTDGSAFRPGLVYDAGFLDYVGFLCDEAPDAVDPAFCEFLESIGVPTEAHNLNYPSIGVAQLAGSETVTRTVTSVAPGTVDYEVSVEAPDGYDVTVTPSTFSIVEGGTQTFEVEIDNLTGPIGEWAFGSLTWNDSSGDFAVRSPIAVRGSLFAAPEEVEGSGVNGSASFEVKFGYTGDYEALAHGLVPATLTVDNVGQDPDQTFDPADVAAGGANAHTFALSGAAHFRIAIPPEATEADADLDVYVFDPTNTLVAQSTLGGTDELIDISSPADGTWTVYVHGWQAPGGDSDYTMYSWAISETPGGNLRIVSAPTSATLGATGTVTVSWTGAAIGQWHLGAVSHNRGSEVLGLTLVEVDNRS